MIPTVMTWNRDREARGSLRRFGFGDRRDSDSRRQLVMLGIWVSVKPNSSTITRPFVSRISSTPGPMRNPIATRSKWRSARTRMPDDWPDFIAMRTSAFPS